MRTSRALLLATSATLLGLIQGCGSNAAPTIDPLPAELNVLVNDTLEVTVRGHDEDGDTLTFSFSSDIPELKDRDGVQFYSDGKSALFRWTPRAGDIGNHPFTFTASDGQAS